MIIDRISNREQLAKLRCEWNALAGNVPFRRWDWQDAWWHHYGRSRELCVLAVRDSGGATIGIAPWFADTTIFDGHVLQFLGTGQACSDYLSLLCRPRHMKEVTTGLAKWLCGRHTQTGDGDRASLNWDYLRLAVCRDVRQACCAPSRASTQPAATRMFRVKFVPRIPATGLGAFSC